MAQASVSEAIPSRFFCHRCDQDIDPLPEFICPRCRSGFIEEVATENEAQDGDIIDMHEPQAENPHPPQAAEHQLADILENVYGRFAVSNGSGRDSGRSGQGPAATAQGHRPEQHLRHLAGRLPRPTNAAVGGYPQAMPQDSTQAIEGIFQQILSSVANAHLPGDNYSFPNSRGVGAPRGAGGVGGTVRGQVNFDFPLFQVLHAHPGDYAWGQGGLDAVISQLLNQLDATGPAPMPKEEIDRLPLVKITKEDVDRNLQCSVCMEDYKVDESVRKLSCSHVFHNDCIIPWLQMHATCPICRLNLGNNGENSGRRSTPGAGQPEASSSSSPVYFDISDYD